MLNVFFDMFKADDKQTSIEVQFGWFKGKSYSEITYRRVKCLQSNNW